MWLFYVRHGRPDYAKDCLTEEGKKQARALAERFALSGLDKIYSSTMGRATETAEYTAKKLGLNIEGLDFAREDIATEELAVRYGDDWKWCFWDKDTIAAFKTEEIKRLGEKWYDSPVFAGTKYKSCTIRVRKAVVEFMEGLGYRYNAKTGYYSAAEHKYDRVALFAHGGFSMIFTSCLLGIPFPEFCTRFQHIGVSAVTSFYIADEGDDIIPVLYQYGNDGHLYKENLLDGFDFRTF